jgi:hypothetical protein
MNDESFHQANRRNGFGGHYETLYFDGEKFCYLDNIRYFAFAFVFDENGSLRSMSQLPNYVYRSYGDYSLVETEINAHTNAVVVLPLINDQILASLPTFRNPIKLSIQPNRYDFNCFICHSRLIDLENNTIDISGSKIYFDGDNELMTYDTSQDSYTVNVSFLINYFYGVVKKVYEAWKSNQFNENPRPTNQT